MLFEKIKDEGVDQLYLVRCANSVESVKSCLSLFRSAIHALRGTRKQGGRSRRRECVRSSEHTRRQHAVRRKIQTSRCRRTQCVLARSSTKCPTPVGRELTVQT